MHSMRYISIYQYCSPQRLIRLVHVTVQTSKLNNHASDINGVCSEPELDPFNESAAPELQYTEFSTQYLVSTKHFLNLIYLLYFNIW